MPSIGKLLTSSSFWRLVRTCCHHLFSLCLSITKDWLASERRPTSWRTALAIAVADRLEIPYLSQITVVLENETKFRDEGWALSWTTALASETDSLKLTSWEEKPSNKLSWSSPIFSFAVSSVSTGVLWPRSLDFLNSRFCKALVTSSSMPPIKSLRFSLVHKKSSFFYWNLFRLFARASVKVHTFACCEVKEFLSTHFKINYLLRHRGIFLDSTVLLEEIS